MLSFNIRRKELTCVLQNSVPGNGVGCGQIRQWEEEQFVGKVIPD